MAVAIPTLDMIVQEYLNDTKFQEERQTLIAKRNASISTLRSIVLRFIHSETNLNQFRDDLKVLHQMKEWGASFTGFLMEINKLAKYHAGQSSDVEATLRFILTDLNNNTLGQHIEQFTAFLEREHQRLGQLGKKGQEIVSTKASAFIMSLFACWLDEGNVLCIYYPSFRSGLAMLLRARVLPAPANLTFDVDQKKYPTIIVDSEATHLAIVQVVNNLVQAAPKLRSDGPSELYWAERFLQWVRKRYNAELTGPAEGGADAEIEIDEEEEAVSTYLGITYGRKTIDDTNLSPISQERLLRRIAEVQSQILVDDEVIRRIYYALLAGHVILAGPPGTGKTELARLIPEILWQNDQSHSDEQGLSEDIPTAYTTMLVTATEGWSTHTLISSIVPAMNNGQVAYRMQYGHLSSAILKNWSIIPDQPSTWQIPQRMTYLVDGDPRQHFRGHWLIIDEFNRSHIDTALGEALTSLGGSLALFVNCEDNIYRKLPIPIDFRIIGTLNSFDRNYLNQISEALKRRFSFVEVLPPSRKLRDAERRIVRYKALESIRHLLRAEEADYDDAGEWRGYAAIIDEEEELLASINIQVSDAGASGANSYHREIYLYEALWLEDMPPLQEAFKSTCNIAWVIFEVIRVYRQLGTAQGIALIRYMLIAALMSHAPKQKDQWLKALDMALCDTVADQLQILLPDELDVLIWYLTLEAPTFIGRYNDALGKLASKPRRLRAQLEALNKIVDISGNPILSEQQLESLVENSSSQLHLPEDVLKEAFRLDIPLPELPQFIRRLRTFKAEHGL